ncbi:hypothetical protein PIB30_079078, partial [Stylosanthes scabra]|nr:hypothetical protein [Stylosanthes scabra]
MARKNVSGSTQKEKGMAKREAKRSDVRDLFKKRQKDFEDKLNEEEKEALDLFKGKSLTFKSFLLPTSSAYISPVHLPIIKDIDNTQGRNWAHHVNSFLINGIKEFHEQSSRAVKGCHFILMIIYFRESAAKPMHDATVAETGPEPGPQPQPGPEPEPETETEPQPQPDSEQVSEPQPQPNPEPVFGPQPQPEPKAAILFGLEPQEVIDGFVAACQEVEETEAAIKACEEAKLRYQQINQAEVAKDNEAEAEIRKIIEDVVTGTDKLPGRQEEAAPAPHKL